MAPSETGSVHVDVHGQRVAQRTAWTSPTSRLRAAADSVDEHLDGLGALREADSEQCPANAHWLNSLGAISGGSCPIQACCEAAGRLSSRSHIGRMAELADAADLKAWGSPRLSSLLPHLGLVGAGWK